MRVYAVLMGVVLTGGSAGIAQLAIASAGFERIPARSTGRRDLGARGELWYGGVLDPITIEAKPAGRPALAAHAPRVRRSDLAAGR
jgi:hypothetical protein